MIAGTENFGTSPATGNYIRRPLMPITTAMAMDGVEPALLRPPAIDGQLKRILAMRRQSCRHFHIDFRKRHDTLLGVRP